MSYFAFNEMRAEPAEDVPETPVPQDPESASAPPHSLAPVQGPSPSRSRSPLNWDAASPDRVAQIAALQTIIEGMATFGNTLTTLTEAVSHLQTRSSMSPGTGSCEQEPKVNPLTEFDRSSHQKLETFIAECEILFATLPHWYHAESSKIHSAGLYLKGDPKKWFSNFFLLKPAHWPLWFLSWEDFKAELRRTWGLEDPEGAAEHDLRQLKMSDKDRVVYFASRFRAVQYRLPSWSDCNFRNSFYAALAPRIRTQFVTAGRAPPPTLDDLIAAAEGFDQAYWTDVELK